MCVEKKWRRSRTLKHAGMLDTRHSCSTAVGVAGAAAIAKDGCCDAVPDQWVDGGSECVTLALLRWCSVMFSFTNIHV